MTAAGAGCCIAAGGSCSCSGRSAELEANMPSLREVLLFCFLISWLCTLIGHMAAPPLHMLLLSNSASPGAHLLHHVCLLVYSLPMSLRQLELVLGPAAV